ARAVLEEFQQRGGTARRDAHGGGERILGEVETAAGRERGGERAADRRRVPAPRVKPTRRRHPEPRDGLVTRDGGRDDLPAREPTLLTERERRRQHHRGGVPDRGRVGGVQARTSWDA